MAYDTIPQSEVSAELAAQNSGFELYRYECICCGEEVFIAAAYSTKVECIRDGSYCIMEQK